VRLFGEKYKERVSVRVCMRQFTKNICITGRFSIVTKTYSM